MPRIELSLTANYCPDWKLWEGIREIMQNAIDEQEFNGGRMIADHMPRSDKLIVTSEGVRLDHSVLLLGESGKTGEERGHFGEGLKVGVLALVRAGHPVTIYNGDEVWRPVLEPSDTFAGKNVLMFQTRKLNKSREDFSIEVENVSRPVWDELKKKFLFLSPPKVNDIIKVTGGTVLLHADRKGEIYVKGIYINDIPDIECGYDLDNLKLDRDRRMVDAWDVKYKLGQLWVHAQQMFPERVAARLFGLAKAGKGDAENLHFHADDRLITAMQKEMEKVHGEGVVAVTESSDKTRLEACGIKAVVVNRALQKVLQKNQPPLDDIIDKAQSGVKLKWDAAALNAQEQSGLETVERVIGQNYQIVEFNDGKPYVRLVRDEELICVGRGALTLEARELLERLVRTEAQRRKCDEREVYLDLLVVPAEALKQSA